MLEHGGSLQQVIAQYDMPAEQWIDLSTGINPHPWPIVEIPLAAWSRLPEDADTLVATAKHYYQCQHLLPVAGSQAAIQALPGMRPQGHVGMLHPAYAEHAHAWQGGGHKVVIVDHNNIDNSIQHIDNLLLVHPNNPAGQTYTIKQLLFWHRQLRKKDGWLVIDEAFIDCTPEASLASYSHLPGLIVLRSLGKFFGLAGARVGFVLAQAELLAALAEILGPWTVSGPARYMATQALADKVWHIQTQQQLSENGQRLRTLLKHYQLTPEGGCDLFQWLPHPHTAILAEHFRQQGILLREFIEPASLRFGLPADEAQWQRLKQALQKMPGSIQP